MLLTFFVGVVPAGAAPQNSVTAGAVRVDATFHHIGVYWEIAGDDDLDSTMTLEFRPAGTPDWKMAAPAMRAYPSVIVNGNPLGLNSWAASAMFVDPGVTYELRLSLTDPDGGGAIRTVTGATRTKPAVDPGGRQLDVVPGAGGGDGSAASPFRGLQAAADAAVPGDVFHVAAGMYDGFTITTSGTAARPISFVGPSSGQAIVDGGGTDREVIAIGAFDTPTGYVIVRNLVVQNGRWGIDAQRTHNIVIEDNTIRDVDFGVYNRRGYGDELNQTVCNNTITGRTAWPQSGIPSERGIDLRGTGNVACYNRVTYFGDCISVQPSTGPSYGNDVYGNDAAYCVDDGIEIDYNRANVRVWRNRVTNARMGISVQPIYGGPAYLFRNELFNLESNPIKLNNSPSGLVVAHNTAVKHNNGLGDPGVPWTNAIFRNNLFLGTAYAFEFTTVAPSGFRDFDYDGWGTTRAVGGASAPYFKWDNVRYDRITDLPSGVEDHGTEVSFPDLVDASLTASWDVPITPGSRDLRLSASSAGINRGADPCEPERRIHAQRPSRSRSVRKGPAASPIRTGRPCGTRTGSRARAGDLRFGRPCGSGNRRVAATSAGYDASTSSTTATRQTCRSSETGTATVLRLRASTARVTGLCTCATRTLRETQTSSSTSETRAMCHWPETSTETDATRCRSTGRPKAVST